MNLGNQIEFAKAWSDMGILAQDALDALRDNKFSDIVDPQDVQIVRENLEDLAPDVVRLCDSYSKWYNARHVERVAALRSIP